jgi:hypothetical protein
LAWIVVGIAVLAVGAGWVIVVGSGALSPQ